MTDYPFHIRYSTWQTIPIRYSMTDCLFPIRYSMTDCSFPIRYSMTDCSFPIRYSMTDFHFLFVIAWQTVHSLFVISWPTAHSLFVIAYDRLPFPEGRYIVADCPFHGRYNMTRMEGDFEKWNGVLGRNGIGIGNENELLLLEFCSEKQFVIATPCSIRRIDSRQHVGTHTLYTGTSWTFNPFQNKWQSIQPSASSRTNENH